MKNRIIICSVVLSILVFLTGCWNRRELNTLSIVHAIGIDKVENNQIRGTFQIIKPSEVKAPGKGGGSGGSSGSGVWVCSSTGQTVFDALRNASMEADRKLSITHNEVIVIGENAAKSGIAPIIDFFSRDHETRLFSKIFIARGSAQDILKAEHEQEKMPGKAIEDLAKVTFATSKLPNVDLLDILNTQASKTSSHFITGIKTIEKEVDGKMKKLIKLDETAIFDGDKLIDWFDGIETRGLLWIIGKVKSGIIVVKSPGKDDGNVSIEIVKASSTVKPEIVDGRLVITVKVKEEGSIGEQMSGDIDLTDINNFKDLESKQADVIKSEIYAALKKAQNDLGVDVFKFNETVRRKCPKQWKQLEKKWKEEFKNIAIKVQVESRLTRTGMKTMPEKLED